MKADRCLFIALLLSGACGSMNEVETPLVAGPGNGTVAQIQQAVATAERGIVLIDRTGSMSELRSNLHTRCADALNQAAEKVDEFFLKQGGSAVAIWTFNGSTVVRLTDYVGQSSAKAAIASLSATGCTDLTPLADAMCEAIDELATYPVVSTKAHYLTVLTDGGENNSRGGCSGSTAGFGVSGSWRTKVGNNAMAKGVKLNTAFFQNQSSTTAKRLDPETGLAIAPTLGSDGLPTDPDHDAFLSMALVTGGVYDLMNDRDNKYSCNFGYCPAPYYEPSDW